MKRTAKMTKVVSFVLGFALVMMPSLARGNEQADQLFVYPETIDLSGADASHRLIVQAKDADGITSDVSPKANVTIADPSVAQWVDRRVVTAGDGQTRLEVEFQGKKIAIPINATDARERDVVSFERDVVPILTKSGCNSGRCHGAARGKDGFHLSLFGYDAEGDHFGLTEQIAGRRINYAMPAESLLLRKAVGAVRHTGGKLMDESDDAYQKIHRWISEGARLDKLEHPDPVSLTLFPPLTTTIAGQQQSIVVMATYHDGSTRDVTDLCVYSTTNDHVATIDAEKGIQTHHAGEGFVMARFATITQRAPVIVLPTERDQPETDLTDLIASDDGNPIDQWVAAKLKRLRLRPSASCDDATFLRRVYLDLIGLTPSTEDYQRYFQWPPQTRRTQLVDELLDQPEFVDLWAMKWGELLRIRTANQVSYKALMGFHQWLRDSLADNTPWNQIAAQVLSAEGGTFENPPANYYQIEPDPLQITENVAQVFLGMRIQCAKCHNHPFDRWTMDDYYGFADFFSQIDFKQSRDPREFIVYNRGRGEIEHFIKGRDVQPKFLGGETPEVGNRDRRAVLADWIASADNPFFAQRMTNWVWQHHFGRGIVDPVDDFRISNPPSNPELLEGLSKRFAEHEYDIRWLVRTICLSDTYQRSSLARDSNTDDVANFSKASVRRIRAEFLLDSISQITGTGNRFPRLPADARAVQIADGAVSNYFLSTFGRTPRETVCSCEVESTPTLSQAFHLLNGDTTNKKIRDGDRVGQWLDEGWTAEQIISELYRLCFSREITTAEKQRLVETIDPSDPKASLEDIFWALLNSKEFLFNH